MDNSNKPKSSFLMFIPKATSAVSFQNPQFCPGRDHHHHHHHRHRHRGSSMLKAHAYKGFSGPINFSILPDEAQGKPKDGGYETHEPTSPKVSCMGQIKCKHKKKLKKLATKSNKNNASDVKKKSSSSISNFFKTTQKINKISKGSQNEEHGKRGALDKINTNKKNVTHHPIIPTLGHMKKFASGRDSLGNFDWTAQIEPIDRDRNYYSDHEETRRKHDNDDEEEVIIPFSAPILLGSNLEPRKEVNLWKRRTMAPPPPLALISMVR